MGQKLAWLPENLNLEQEYGLKNPELRKQYQRVLRLTDNGKDYALRHVNFTGKTLHYLQEALATIAHAGYKNYPQVIATTNGKPYAQTETGSYILTEWVEGREADFREYDDLVACAKTLGQLHKLTREYQAAGQDWKRNWRSWLKEYRQLDLTGDKYPEELKQLILGAITAGERALAIAKDKEVSAGLGQPPVLCLGNSSAKNFLIDGQGRCWVVNFEYSNAGPPARDLAELLHQVLANNRGNTELALKVIAAYFHTYPLTMGDLGAAMAFLSFPPFLWGQGKVLQSGDPNMKATALNMIKEGLAWQTAVNKLAADLGF